MAVILLVLMTRTNTIVLKPAELPAPAPAAPVVALDPILLPVCSCESTGSPYNQPKQFNDDGTPLLGVVNPSDIGMCQINRYHHEAEAIRLNYDLATKEGNINMANLLYKRSGLTPWNWSKSCWQKAMPTHSSSTGS